MDTNCNSIGIFRDDSTTPKEERSETLKDIFKTFETLSPIFIALADTVRQTLLLALMKASSDGINVGDLTAKTHLSRPAISHHLKVLKDCGVVVSHKVGTQVFYYFKIGTYLKDLKHFNELLEKSISGIDLNLIKEKAPWML